MTYAFLMAAGIYYLGPGRRFTNIVAKPIYIRKLERKQKVRKPFSFS